MEMLSPEELKLWNKHKQAPLSVDEMSNKRVRWDARISQILSPLLCDVERVIIIEDMDSSKMPINGGGSSEFDVIDLTISSGRKYLDQYYDDLPSFY